MKQFLILCLFASLISCSSKKVTEVKITNENNFPIAITIKANNCKQTFGGIKPHTEFNGIFEWTNIEKKD